MPTTEVDPVGLLERFGLREFRPGQDQVVQAVLSGEDVLCVMPTGGGKSLCYQLPSLALPGTTIVVSPLIALMKDQVDTLLQRGISAALINSTLTAGEQNDAMSQMSEGQYDLVYVAPERLRNSRFLEAISKMKVSLLAVDEAHCISEWGHDFRPDYARLGLFRERYLGGVQTIALTATATPAVRDDISRLLGLKSPRNFVTGFARTNLRFEVAHCKGDREKDAWLTEYLNRQAGSGIIYAATRKRCEELAGWLPEKVRRPIGVYHAGMEPQQRQEVQEQFMSGKLSAIVATNAFGMGIDKSDLRYVVHYNMPGTLEAYYQEAGRAGRDGLPSECVLLFSYSDRHIQEFFIENRYPTAELVKKVYKYLLSRPEDPIELTLLQVRDAVEKESSSEAIGTAETLLGRAGVLKRLDSSSNSAVVRIDSDLPTLVDLLPREAKVRRKVLRAVEKVVGKHRYEDVYVRPQRLCELAEVSREQLARVMRELCGLKALDYVPPFRGRAVHFVDRDIPFESLKIDFDELEERKKGEYEKLESVIGFARTGRCRQREILVYFGDTSIGDCGSCDRCQPVNPRVVAAIGAMGIGATGIAKPARSLPVDDPDLCRGLRIVLSGVARTHGRFGKGLVAQMLCGSQNKKIQQWKLNRLSTYGMLSGLKQTQVSDVIDALTEVGLISQIEVEQRRPTVQLTDDGKSVMLGRTQVPASLKMAYPLAKQLAAIASRMEAADVTGRSPDVRDARAAESPELPPDESETDELQSDELQMGDLSAKAMPESVSDVSEGLEEAESSDPTTELLMGRLKSWRRRLSAASGMPAFRVLSNATLERIAMVKPRSTTELERISGVGAGTVEEYGFDIVEIVVHALTEPALREPALREPAMEVQIEGEAGPKMHEAGPKMHEAGPTLHEAGVKAPRDQDGYWTWRLYSDGYSPDDVMTIRRIDRRRLLEHLIEQAKLGRPVSLSHFPDGGCGWNDDVSGGIAWKPAWQELFRLVAEGGSG